MFEPRKPGPTRPGFQLTPNEVVSIAAARYIYRGISRYISATGPAPVQLYASPGQLNDVLRRAGFHVW